MPSEILFTKEQIASQVEKLGKTISRDYQEGNLLIVAVLKGAFIFAADLVRHISIPLEIDFIRISSYGKESSPSGQFNLTKDLELSVADKDVLVVEDIVDTGGTLLFLLDLLKKRGCRSLKVCALIDKTWRRDSEAIIDYAGFHVEKGFLVGYGLDHAERHRHYSSILKLDE